MVERRVEEETKRLSYNRGGYGGAAGGIFGLGTGWGGGGGGGYQRLEKLKEQIDHLPNDFHILVYGMSYIREISDNIVRHAFREATGPASVKLVVHGENKYPWKKPCYCGLEAKPCPCADFATYHIKRPRAAGGVNGRVTAVVNYEHLQTEANLHHLKALLRDLCDKSQDGNKWEYRLKSKFFSSSTAEEK